MMWKVLLNFKILGILDMFLAICSWIFQIASMATGINFHGDTTKIGSGFWCGITFFLTGAVAFKMHQSELYGQRLIYGCIQLRDAFLFIPVISFICGWIQMIASAVTIYYFKKDPTFQLFGIDVSKLNFSIILLCCGMASILINALIFVAAIKNRNEYELIQNENYEEIQSSDSTAVEESSEQTTIENEL